MTDRGALITYGGYALDDPEAGEALRAAGIELQISPRANDRSASQLLGLIGDAVAVIADADPFEAMVFEHAPNLRVIARTGVGLDSIDLEAATRAGVVVTITPNVNNETVADHALMLILACVRQVAAQDAMVRGGGWRSFGRSGPGQLYGASVGLIGYGAIGRAVGRRLRAFDVQLVVHDPLIGDERAGDVRLVELDELLERSAIVSIHAPLTSSTRGLIDAERIATMRPGAILINTSRGPIVSEEPLVEALRSGRLGAAGLDVFATEPPGVCRLTQLPNVVLSPHIGGISDVSNVAMSRAATRSVLAVLENRRPESAVNPGALAVRGRDS